MDLQISVDVNSNIHFSISFKLYVVQVNIFVNKKEGHSS